MGDQRSLGEESQIPKVDRSYQKKKRWPEYVAPVSGDFLDQTWALILQVVATASICLATKLEGANSEAAIAVRLLCIMLSFAAVRLIINGLAGLALGAKEAENNEEDSSLGVAVKCSCASDS